MNYAFKSTINLNGLHGVVETQQNKPKIIIVSVDGLLTSRNKFILALISWTNIY